MISHQQKKDENFLQKYAKSDSFYLHSTLDLFNLPLSINKSFPSLFYESDASLLWVKNSVSHDAVRGCSPAPFVWLAGCLFQSDQLPSASAVEQTWGSRSSALHLKAPTS